MKLYHGTAARHLPDILANGLRPRGRKGPSNWKHSIESNPDTIYLTNAYAIYFAGQAAKIGEDLAVLEIDTTLIADHLVPDEDWLEQVSRSQEGLVPPGQNKTMKARTRWFRKNLDKFSLHWIDSVQGLGTCGHRGPIPAEAITRAVTFSTDDYVKMIFHHGIDPMITVLNYRLKGPHYRNSLRWLFGDGGFEADPFGNDWFPKAPPAGLPVQEREAA